MLRQIWELTCRRSIERSEFYYNSSFESAQDLNPHAPNNNQPQQEPSPNSFSCKTENSQFDNDFLQTCFARVDVSETFSADQLWFRIFSGLFQRCSLPENLWTALIQLWTALKTEIFRAKNQRWNSAVSALIFSETALIQSSTALISSETPLNSADFWINQNDNCWYISLFSKLV